MNDWIKNLKVGDFVFINGRFSTALRKVEKITPAGNIKVGGLIFNSSGSERNSDRWSRRYLSETTPERIKSYREKITINKAKDLMEQTREITLEQAIKIIEVLSDTTEKGGADDD